ncbi:MAG: YicC/YloC family endoribonuclease [Candidatus Eisenbacteria bacterium]
MLRSMTGYGGAEGADGGRSVRIDVRSVNQRFLDIQVKAPRLLLPVEDRIRKAVEARLARGRVTVFVDWRDSGGTALVLNASAARGLVRDLRALGDDLSLKGDLDLSALAAFPQIFESAEERPGADELWSFVSPVLSRALDDLVSMREAEGSALRTELERLLNAISAIVSSVEEAAPVITKALKARVLAKITDLLDGVVPVDDARITQEAAMAAERADFTEEVVRLKAHESQARESIESDAPSGKRLNFLVQEMHREANTIGSKTADTEVSGAIIALKEEIEKFREQVQNVE